MTSKQMSGQDEMMKARCLVQSSPKNPEDHRGRAKNSMRTSVNYRTKLDLDRTINDMHGHCVRPKGVASKRTRNKVFSLAGEKMRYATGQEAII